ncbi:MAG: hypothetical protein LBN95_03090 [Prevotellaceae bacterium]|jgi:hypothetical protein|nr:hypothetical protein [Prevotellaceae bacterium]
MKLIDKKYQNFVPVGILLMEAQKTTKTEKLKISDLLEINVPNIQNPKCRKRDYYKSITRF